MKERGGTGKFGNLQVAKKQKNLGCFREKKYGKMAAGISQNVRGGNQERPDRSNKLRAGGGPRGHQALKTCEKGRRLNNKERRKGGEI